MQRAFSTLLPTLLLLYLSHATASTYQWDDFLQSIDFAQTTSAPFQLFSANAFSSIPRIWTSVDPPLGPYGSHAWTPAQARLVYKLNLQAPQLAFVDVKLGFAEVYQPACTKSARVMQVSVNDQTLSDVDIFHLVGCRKPHDIIFERVQATSQITITIEPTVQNAMLANLVVRRSTSPSTDPVSTTAPSTSALVRPTTPQFSARPPSFTPKGGISRPYYVSNRILYIPTISTNSMNQIAGTSVFRDNASIIEGTIRPQYLLGHRHGKRFSYHFTGKGRFQIELAFAETDPRYCDGTYRRIFSVDFNGKTIPHLNRLDVFSKRGCARAFVYNMHNVEVNERAYITFKTVKGDAMISHIVVRPVMSACTPVSTGNGRTSDHLAHSVPGDYPPTGSGTPVFFDDNQDGYESVRINGDGSHTHFFDTQNNIRGKLISYEWTSPDTKEFITSKKSFRSNFRLGTTNLMLKVRDNLCTVDEASTAVTVAGTVMKGTYCYFYPGSSSRPLAGGPNQEVRPTFAKAYPNSKWDFSDLPFASGNFAARCEFFVEVGSRAKTIVGSVTTKGSGSATVLRGADVVVEETALSGLSISDVPAISAFEVLYTHKAGAATPQLIFSVKQEYKPTYTFDRKTVFPVITALVPNSASAQANTKARVEIIGAAVRGVTVIIGGERYQATGRNPSSMQLFFNVPPGEAGQVPIEVRAPGGRISNSLLFTYTAEAAVDSIAFSKSIMTSGSGAKASSEFATTIRFGNDGNFYLGTLDGRVMKLSYEIDTLKITSKCGSAKLEDEKFARNGTLAPRGILGMVFDPRDAIPRPYVSAQTLFWLKRDKIDPDNPAGWRNAAIELFKPGTDPSNPAICIVYDKRVVSGLPVSNHDHGVNGLEFTQDGDLLIAIGGNTNAGLPGYKLGGLWETPLSASIILVKLSKGQTFNGEIKYANDDVPHLSRIISGDVEFVATGLRNPFFPSLHSSGRLYSTSNGPNGGFGNVASTCSAVNKNITIAPGEETDFPGEVQIGPQSNKFSVARPDKILNIKLDGKPRFYGHPNINRGECMYVDPFTGKGPSGENPPGNFDSPLLTVTSSVNAIVEYHAGNIFNGALQGKLILSTYNDRTTYFIPPISNPDDISPEVLSEDGGLAAAVDPRGQIIIPRINENNILVLKPTAPQLEAQTGVTVIAVTPFRHGRGGGTIATLGGYNMNTGTALVKVGGRNCPIISQSAVAIKCRVPPAEQPGAVVTVEVTVGQGDVSILEKGLWYMNK